MSFGHLPGAFLEIFFWFQKATLGSRLALNLSRRPKLPLNPSRRPWRPSSLSFGHLPGAFPVPLAAQQHVLAYASFFSSLFQLLCVHGRPAGVLC